MLLQQVLKKYGQSGKALLAANFYNAETLSGILEAAKNTNRPVILQLSESSIAYLGLKVATALAKSALLQTGVTGWLHLDHGGSLDMVSRCLDAGFDSVMIDASEQPFDENVKMTRAAVELASRYGANVEAELGFIPKLGQSSQAGQYTQPEEARRFVEATGVPALAIAIGTAHGFYKEEPQLQLDLLSQIHAATPAALVLHGSSGIPDAQLKKAISNGISKINLATETKNAFMKKLQEILKNTTEIDLRKVFPEATAAVTTLITEKLTLIG